MFWLLLLLLLSPEMSHKWHTYIYILTLTLTHMLPATGIHQNCEVIVNILCRQRTCRIFHTHTHKHTFFVRCVRACVCVCVYCMCFSAPVCGKDAPVHAVIIHFVIINVKHIRLQLPTLKCSKFSHTHTLALATPTACCPSLAWGRGVSIINCS